MKLFLQLLGMTLFFSGGGMAKENWSLIKDEETGLEAQFPLPPLEMTFEFPFQNTPPTGYLHLYSVPIQKGVFVMSIFKSSDPLFPLNKEGFKDFFERQLISRLFYDPSLFQERQVFQFYPEGEKEASFLFSYQDHGIEKQLEGGTMREDHILYTYFYLASKKDFNQEMFQDFSNSIHLPRSQD